MSAGLCQGPPETQRELECMSGFRSHPYVWVWDVIPGGIITHPPLSFNHVSGGGGGARGLEGVTKIKQTVLLDRQIM